MKTILIRRLNVVTVFRSTVFPLVILGLAAGLLAGIFLTPASYQTGLSINGGRLIEESVTSVSPWRGIAVSTLCLGAGGFLVSLTLVLAALLFNLFCSFGGGIAVEVEEQSPPGEK